MEKDIENKVYNEITMLLREYKNFTVYQNLRYEFKGRYADIDIVIKRDDVEVAIIEIKQNLESHSLKNLQQAEMYSQMFPIASPFIIFADHKSYWIWEKEQKQLYKICLCEVRQRIIDKNIIEKRIEKKKFLKALVAAELNNESIKNYLYEIKRKCEDQEWDTFFECKGKYFYFKEDKEIEFFQHILKGVPYYKYDDLYRYTTFDTLFKTIDAQQQALVSVICMNDKTECYYADEYYRCSKARRLRTNSKKDAIDVTSNYKEANDVFIMSCVDDEEERLLMWNMYGNRAQGVRIYYHREEDRNCSDFFIAPVNYAKDYDFHPMLDFLYGLMDGSFGLSFKFANWEVWKHFFKPYEYREEKEVRILYWNKKRNKKPSYHNTPNAIIPLIKFDFPQFPYRIEAVRLGPAFPDSDRQRVVLEKYVSGNIGIEGSKIKSY